MLGIWLLKKSSYFEDGVSPSPLSLSKVLTAKIVSEWLKTIEKERA
jgi:hypothetical protein